MGLLTVMVFVRLVGYEQYGRYAVFFALVTACSTGGAGWISQGILRFHSQHAGSSQEDTFLLSSRIGMLFSCVVAGAVVSATTWKQSSDLSLVAIVTLALFVPMLIYTVELTRLQASLRSEVVVWVEAVRAVASFLLPIVFVLILKNRSYVLLLAGMGIGYLIPLALRFRRDHSANSSLHSKLVFGQEERRALKKIWSYGWPVALWLGCQQSLVLSDRYFIQRFLGYSQAGIYASVYDVIVRSLSLVFAPITLSVHSVLMHHWNTGNREATADALKKAIICEILLFIPVPLFLIFLRNWIARLILGNANAQATAALIPLAISGFLWQLALLAHKPLEMLCRTKRMLVGSLAALALNVVGNFVLVPKFGFLASAYLAVGSACLYLLLLAALVPTREFASEMGKRKTVIHVIAVEETGN